MKLPPTAPPSLAFQNAPGSTVPEINAVAARRNPDDIAAMAENAHETAQLRKEALARQYVLIVDRSGSMGARDGRGTRWDSARVAVEKIIQTVFKYDIDHSVPLYLFDHQVEFVGECTDVGQVLDVFRAYGPRGSTDLAQVLAVAMEQYAGAKRPNYATVPGVTFLVLLDGGADDGAAVQNTLHKFADPRNGYVANHSQIAVSFVQIGDDPPGGIDVLLYDAIFD